MTTTASYISLPNGEKCYSGPTCQRHGAAIKAMGTSVQPLTSDPASAFEAAVTQSDQVATFEPVEIKAKGAKLRELVPGESHTYADLIRSGDKGSRVVTSIDMSTPPGHFVASVRMLGITTEYLIEGDEGDKKAKILGRIELYKDRGSVYRGSELKGGEYLGRIGSESGMGFDDAFDKIAAKPDPLPAPPAATPGPFGQQAGVGAVGDLSSFTHRTLNYNVNSYSDHRSVAVKQVRTNGEFKKAIRQLRAEPYNAVRVVEVNFGKNHGYFSERPVVHGPKDGTPLVIDFVNGYTSLEVAEGNVVINATATYGGGVIVKRGAAATIITPHGKFNIDAEAGSAITVYPRSGARGRVLSDEGANVMIDDLYEHTIENRVRKRD